MRYSLVADHWQYTALIGVVALAAGLLAWVMERPGRLRTVAMAAAGALVLACAALTFRQTLIYHDEETLWRDTLAKNPKAWIAYGNLAGLLVQKAAAPGADSAALLDEAERCCEEALALQPQQAESYAHRALVRLALGQGEAAMQDYDKVIELNPTPSRTTTAPWPPRAWAGCSRPLTTTGRRSGCGRVIAQAYGNRALAFMQLAAAQTGQAQAELRRRAFEDFDKAVALEPDYALAIFNRGNAWMEIERPAEAIADYTRAIAINPDYAAAYLNRAIAYYTVKDYARALSDARSAEHSAGIRTPNSSASCPRPPAGDERPPVRSLDRSGLRCQDTAFHDLERKLTCPRRRN